MKKKRKTPPPSLLNIRCKSGNRIELGYGLKKTVMTKNLFLEQNGETTEFVNTSYVLLDLISGELTQINGNRKQKGILNLEKYNFQSEEDFHSFFKNSNLDTKLINLIVELFTQITANMDDSIEFYRIMSRFYQPKNNNKENYLIEVYLFGRKERYEFVQEHIFIKNSVKYQNSSKLLINWRLDPPDRFGYISEKGKLVSKIMNSFSFKFQKNKVFHLEYRDIIIVKIKPLTTTFGSLRGEYSSDMLECNFDVFLSKTGYSSHSIEYLFLPSIVEFQIPGPILGIFSPSEIVDAILLMCHRSDMTSDDSIQTLSERFTEHRMVNIGTFWENISDDFLKKHLKWFKEIYLSSKIDQSVIERLRKRLPEKCKVIPTISHSPYITKEYDVAIILPAHFQVEDITVLSHSAAFINFLNAKFFYQNELLVSNLESSFNDRVVRNKIVYNLVCPNKELNQFFTDLKKQDYIIIDLRPFSITKKNLERITSRYIIERTFSTFLSFYMPSKLDKFDEKQYTLNNPQQYAIKLLKKTNLLKKFLIFLSPDKKDSRRAFVELCNKIHNSLDQEEITLSDISEFWALVQLKYNITTIPNHYTYLEKFNSWTIIDENLSSEYLISAVMHSIFYAAPFLMIKNLNTGYIGDIADTTYRMIENSNTSELSDYFNQLSHEISKNLFHDKTQHFFKEITTFLPFVRLLNHMYNLPLKRNDDLMSRAIFSLYSQQKQVLLEIGLGLELNSQISFGRCLIESPKDTFDLTFAGLIYPHYHYVPTQLGVLHKIKDIENFEDAIHFIIKSLNNIEDVKTIELLPRDDKTVVDVEALEAIFAMNFSIVLCHGDPGMIFFQTLEGTTSTSSRQIKGQRKGEKQPIIYLNSCLSANIDEKAMDTVSVAEAFSLAGARVVIAPITVINLKEALPSQIDFIRYIPTGQPLSCIMRRVRNYRYAKFYDTSYIPFILIGDPHIRLYKYTQSEQNRIKKKITHLLDYPGPKGSWISHDIK